MVIVWDLPTRLFHWTLVVLVLSAWVSFRYAEHLGDYQMRWHRINGMAILVLLAWRVVWGFAGPPTARFVSFVRRPADAIRYVAAILAGVKQRYLGHNPIGAYMVLALMGIAMCQGSLGLFTVEHNDITAGPLYRQVSEDVQKLASRWHRVLFYWVLLPAIAVHVTANLLYGLVAREPLIAAMVSGRKPAADYADLAEAGIAQRPLMRALVVLMLASSAVLGPVYALSGRLY